MLKASYIKYLLHFKEPSGTSRGILTDKETYFIRIWEDQWPAVAGVGECALFRGLSAEDCLEYENKLHEVCRNIDRLTEVDIAQWSSIRFGVETALADLKHGGKRICYPSAFTQGKQAIEINGLIWMGDRTTMFQRIGQKLKAGFHCVKLKIGAIDFESELSLLRYIRQEFSRQDVELRVDANGAFMPEEAMKKLAALAAFDLHSIEQPIRQGQWEKMSRLCQNTPIPIALDEELIGVNDYEQKKRLLDTIRPQYIILKPALCGGISGAMEWIRLAKERQIGWWVTSALESNVGLNALAQWVSTLEVSMPQGLGTGQLYTNNVFSPLQQQGEKLYYDPTVRWGLEKIFADVHKIKA